MRDVEEVRRRDDEGGTVILVGVGWWGVQNLFINFDRYNGRNLLQECE